MSIALLRAFRRSAGLLQALYDIRDGIVNHKQSVVSIVLLQHNSTKQNAMDAVLCLQFI